MSDLTSFQYTLLATVNNFGKMSGQEIKREIESNPMTEIDQINHGRLYPNLNTLVEEGLVTKGMRNERTNLYRALDGAEDRLKERAGYLNPYRHKVIQPEQSD